METTQQNVILALWGVRYQVKDVQRSIAFYTQMLGFNLDYQNLPAFGQVSISNLKLILSGPGASAGTRWRPSGPEPTDLVRPWRSLPPVPLWRGAYRDHLSR